MDAIIPATFDSALVSKADNAISNLETLLHILREFGILDELIFSDEMICSSMSRPGLERPGSPHTASRHYRCGLAGPVSKNFGKGVLMYTELLELMTAGKWQSSTMPPGTPRPKLPDGDLQPSTTKAV